MRLHKSWLFSRNVWMNSPMDSQSQYRRGLPGRSGGAVKHAKPAQVRRQVLGGHALEAPHPAAQAADVGVDVLHMPRPDPNASVALSSAAVVWQGAAGVFVCPADGGLRGRVFCVRAQVHAAFLCGVPRAFADAECKNATDHARFAGGKPWKYLLVSHEQVTADKRLSDFLRFEVESRQPPAASTCTAQS